MKVNARLIAGLVHGTLEGDPEVSISGPCGIETAKAEHISFMGNLKYEHYLYSSEAGIVLIPTDFQLKESVKSTLIRVPDVYQAVALLLQHFQVKEQVSSSIAESAIVDPSVKIGEGTHISAQVYVDRNAVIGKHVHIYPQVYIGAEVTIGDYSIIYPGVRIYRDCHMGEYCIIHSNTVIGSDGFGFVKDEDGAFNKVPQIGKVRIGNRVEIGANCTIDRATMGETVIHDGVKLDNLIHIAHNVQIGKHTAMAAQVGVAGSTKIGESCLIGGQVGFAGHIEIADQTEIQAQSGIGASITEKGKKWFGSPAIDYVSYIKSHIIFKKLPELWKKVLSMEKTRD